MHIVLCAFLLVLVSWLSGLSSFVICGIVAQLICDQEIRLLAGHHCIVTLACMCLRHQAVYGTWPMAEMPYGWEGNKEPGGR